MSTSGAGGMLALATRQLIERWAETRNSWRDAKADEFERLYLAELNDSVAAALRAMEDLDKLLGKIHADCD